MQKAKDQEAKNEKKRLKQERDEAEHRKKPRSGRGNKLAEQVAQLRGVVGDGASDAHLEYLLAKARGRVDEAANAYYGGRAGRACGRAPGGRAASAGPSSAAAAGAASDGTGGGAGGGGGAGAKPGPSEAAASKRR